MKNFIKYAAVGLAGYFIGIYEMKYRIFKAIALKEDDKDKESSKEDESQK